MPITHCLQARGSIPLSDQGSFHKVPYLHHQVALICWPKQLAHLECQSSPVIKNRQLLQEFLVQIFKYNLGLAEVFLCLDDRTRGWRLLLHPPALTLLHPLSISSPCPDPCPPPPHQPQDVGCPGAHHSWTCLSPAVCPLPAGERPSDSSYLGHLGLVLLLSILHGLQVVAGTIIVY